MLDGRRILVTGGSRGIGAVMVETLVREGATVVLHYGRSRELAERLAERLGPRVVTIGEDLEQPGAGRRLWAHALEKLSWVDGVVLNAAVVRTAPLLTESDEGWDASWETTLQVNLKAAADIVRAALPHFLERRQGSFVAIASRAAFRGDDPEMLSYAASKAGLVALTRSIARAYAKDGVRAYVVAPGFVETEMAAASLRDPSERARAVAEIPIGELARPEDVAEVAAFLLSGRAPHLTGATLDITGASYVR